MTRSRSIRRRRRRLHHNENRGDAAKGSEMNWFRKNIAVVAAVAQLLIFVAGIAWASGKKDHDLQSVKTKIVEVEKKIDEAEKTSATTAKEVASLKAEQSSVKRTVDKIEKNQTETIRKTEDVKREQAAIKAIQTRIEKDISELHRDIKELLRRRPE